MEAPRGAKTPASKVPTEPPAGAALLTVCEAAYVLRASVDTVYRLIARGALASTRVAGKRFVRRKDLDGYLDGQTTVSRPDAPPPAPPSVGLRESGLWSGKDY